MTAYWPLLNTPTTSYSIQPGCGFLSGSYYAARKACHPAIDLNAITGSDTDLGDPVRAADTGTVLGTMWDSYIGGIVEILHPDGSISGYWHLRDIHVVKGQYVNGGDFIGQVGKGAKLDMAAHLHFYVKRKGVSLALNYWPSTHIKDRQKAEEFIRENYYEPEKWLSDRGAKRHIQDLQAEGREPVRVLIVRGDQTEEVTGKLAPLPPFASVDARNLPTVRVYINDPNVRVIPPTPRKE